MTSSRHRSPHHRALLVVMLAVLLAGCSSEGNDWLAVLKVARDVWDSRDAPVSLDQAAAIPYATLGVRVNDGREQVLVLATDANGERLWASSSRVAITTRDGRIIRTAGFGTDLSGYEIAVGNPTDWRRPHDYSWVADFADLGFYSVAVRCHMQPVGNDAITVLGKQIDTFRVDETCHSGKPDWSFTNYYWISNETGRVWRSIQSVHPGGLTLQIELLRPPLSTGQ